MYLPTCLLKQLPLPVEVLCWALALLAMAITFTQDVVAIALSGISILILAGLASQEN